ncbi:MAG: ABC transporter ATP-binding protein [Opitutales bacterium]
MTAEPVSSQAAKPHIEIRNLTMAYGNFVVQRGISTTIREGEVFIIMGGSGCGKSTLMKHMIGLKEPAEGQVLYRGTDFTAATPAERTSMLQRVGVLYQQGALWSSMTLAENIGLPLEQFTSLSHDEIREVASLKLSLVGLRGFEDFYPSEISGGMRKRAALARAIALDPEILFFDEPSAGLDPISSRRLDDLILQLRDSLGTTIVVVTHELQSIFTIADNSIFLDAETRRPIATGNPRELLENSDDPRVQQFFNRLSEPPPDADEDPGELSPDSQVHDRRRDLQ